MVSGIKKRIAYAKKKAEERRIQASNIKRQMVKWPEYEEFHDIYVYVGKEPKCGYLLILQTEEQLRSFESSPEKEKFEEKFLKLAALVLSQEHSKLRPMIEYESQENLDKNYGGSIARGLAG